MGNKREKAKVGNGWKDPCTHAHMHAQVKKNKAKTKKQGSRTKGKEEKKEEVNAEMGREAKTREVWFGSSGETNHHNDGPVPPG